MATAHAAVLTKPRKLELRDFALPEIKSDDGLLRIEANGLCGTDYYQYLCKFEIGTGKLPIIPGHEPIDLLRHPETSAVGQPIQYPY